MSEIICLDANVVVQWLNISDYPVTSRRVESALDNGSRLVAPALMRYEVTNVLYQSLKVEQVTAGSATALIDALMSLPIDVLHEPPVHEDALLLANRFRSGAAYDAHYVALARHLGAELWTADKRLYNAVQHQLDFVHLVE